MSLGRSMGGRSVLSRHSILDPMGAQVRVCNLIAYYAIVLKDDNILEINVL
jgi:hypothetical protein